MDKNKKAKKKNISSELDSDLETSEEEIKKPVKKHVKKEDKKEDKKNYIDKICIPEINYKMKFNITNNMQDISPAIWYYNGNKYEKGLYMCLLSNIYVKIPFPEVIDSTKEYKKNNTLRCNYGTAEECNYYKMNIAKSILFKNKPCNYSHTGEKIVKVGITSRCFNIVNFGNSKTLLNDIPKIHENDIKQILLYGLNDIISTIVWMDKTKFNEEQRIINNLDIG